MSDFIAQAIQDAAQAHHDALEAACERMLVDERGWGVLEHHEPPLILPSGREVSTFKPGWRIELSPLVPFGEFHLHVLEKGRPCAGCEKGSQAT